MTGPSPAGLGGRPHDRRALTVPVTTGDARAEALANLRTWCIAHEHPDGDGGDSGDAGGGIAWQESPVGHFAIVLPGEQRQRIPVSVIVGDHSVSINAFIMRRPAQNADRVHRVLLERNRRGYTLAYALDHLGDIYVVGRRGLPGLDVTEIDRLLAAVHASADDAFTTLLALGFPDAIRAEYSWRSRRGLPTTNLAAFTELVSGGDGVTGVSGGGTIAEARLTDSRFADDTTISVRRPAMPDRLHTLILLRHGESEWNAANLFTGWVDVNLSERGVSEAQHAGTLLREAGLAPTIVHTSLLTRAIRTANIALGAADRLWIPVRRSWRLNERHYGALQGLNKAETLARYGPEQFNAWRRSYDVPPPPIEPTSPFAQDGDPRYAHLAAGELPRTECLADVVTRMRPYLDDVLTADLRAGEQVLIVAHGNSLRALIMHLDGVDAAEIAALNVPTGIPLVYSVTDDLRPAGPGQYLDPAAAAAAIAAVAAQGQPTG